MAITKANISDQIHQASLWANGLKNDVQQSASQKVHAAQTYIVTTSLSIRQTCVDTAQKTKQFIYDHKEEIFFTGCSAVTAFFAPHLFFPAAVITIIIRVELNWHLKKLAKEYLKDDHNPYLLNALYGPRYVSTLDLSMGTIAAIDSLALGTIYIAGSWSIALLPALGGIAAGSAAAKLGMDIAQKWF